MIDFESLMPNIILDDIGHNNGYTSISQLTILTIKSLLPMKESVGNKIDYKRFSEEVKLWNDYKIGENNSLLTVFKELDKDKYLTYYDELFYTRLIPIIIANKDWEVIQKEVIKNLLYSSGSIENLFEWLLIGLIIHLSINKVDKIDDKVKEYIIHFSQADFVDNYSDYFQLDISRIPNTYKINFEKERIILLDILNGKDNKKYLRLQDIILAANEGEPNTRIGKMIYKTDRPSHIEESLDSFYISMNKYLLNLRKGRIDLEDLKIKEYKLPDIFGFEEGEVFFHSLLNNCKVIKKEARAGVITSLISTKTGNYLFKRS